MARKKLVFAKDGEEEEDRKQTLDKEGEGAAPVSPKKMKLNADRERVGPEPAENGSACSSPSASGFIVMPTLNPKKKPSSTKIFSDEDEIALLRGLAVFWADGRNNKWAEFYHFIKDHIGNQFSKVQVSEKVRKLKIKFEMNFAKAMANGGKTDFLDSHESNVFRLCKGLWGDEKGENEDEEGNKIERKRKQVNEDGESSKMQKKGKKVNEGVRKKMNERKQVCESGEKGKKLEQEKQVDEHHQEDHVPEKEEQVDELKQDNNNSAEKGKEQLMEISQEYFQSEFPLFYASFDTFKYPNIVKEICVLIPREKAQEVEDKCRELKAEALRLELKRIDLFKRDLQNQLEEI